MPDAAGNFKGIRVPDIPWHEEGASMRTAVEANDDGDYDVVDVVTKEKHNEKPLSLSAAQSLSRQINNKPRPKGGQTQDG